VQIKSDPQDNYISYQLIWITLPETSLNRIVVWIHLHKSVTPLVYNTHLSLLVGSFQGTAMFVPLDYQYFEEQKYSTTVKSAWHVTVP